MKYVKKDGMVHYYAFLSENEVGSEIGKIKNFCSQSKKKCRILRKVKAGQHKPRAWRFVFDVKVM